MIRNDIIMLYPAYAGGKFISNCLSLSKHCVPWTNFDLSKLDDYQYRLQVVNQSLPNADNMKKWLRYEFNEPNTDSEFYIEAKQKGLSFFHMLHNADAFKTWKQKDLVALTNYEKFRQLAYKLKKTNRKYVDINSEERYNTLKGANWPEYNLLQRTGFDTKKLELLEDAKQEIHNFYPLGSSEHIVHTFDMNTIFNKQYFLTELKCLYKKLGLEDFNAELSCIFYNNYAKIHNIGT